MAEKLEYNSLCLYQKVPNNIITDINKEVNLSICDGNANSGRRLHLLTTRTRKVYYFQKKIKDTILMNNT